MSTQIKQRIIGGLVLLALLAIFLPLFFNNPHPSATLSNHAPGVPSKPQVQLQLPQIAQTQQVVAQQPMAQQQIVMTEAPAPQQVAVQAVSSSVPVVKVEPVAKAEGKPVVVAVKPVVAVVKTKVIKPLKPVVSSKAWVVQLASFGSSANAKRLVKKLQQSGYDAYTRHATNANGRVIHKVFVGPEINRHRIESLQSQLSKHYRLKGMIRRYHV